MPKLSLEDYLVVLSAFVTLTGLMGVLITQLAKVEEEATEIQPSQPVGNGPS
jgi:hypothetical protein